jgi:hypothetical protein
MRAKSLATLDRWVKAKTILALASKPDSIRDHQPEPSRFSQRLKAMRWWKIPLTVGVRRARL